MPLRDDAGHHRNRVFEPNRADARFSVARRPGLLEQPGSLGPARETAASHRRDVGLHEVWRVLTPPLPAAGLERPFIERPFWPWPGPPVNAAIRVRRPAPGRGWPAGQPPARSGPPARPSPPQIAACTPRLRRSL